MGKKSSKRWKNKKNKNANAETNEKGVRKQYEEIIKENADFETYYKLQKICPEEEWDNMMTHLKTSLPTTFRITGSRSEARALLHVLQKHLIRDAVLAGKSDPEGDIGAFPLPWYPQTLGWQISLTRKDIRRNEAYFRLHNFLISETETGNISRQEAVSMIPPLALQVEPHHKVLDLCAAPGSKTAQLIEMIHGEEEGINTSGFVVANDLDNKRCYMLVHQGKRLLSPAFIVTNHDASRYPDVVQTDENGALKKFKFDRVLCDVPCSGDGTMRKNIDVWKKWSTSNGLFLHQVQYHVLKRGLELLEVGGKLVYSTCSLNPIEDEAVLHRMLKDAEGSVELLDIDLPHLKHTKGMSHWTPCTRDLVQYKNFEEVPVKWQTTVRPYMFPPTPEDAPKYHFEKCVRVLPHQQDTGGFFIALLTKTRLLPWEKTEVELKPEEAPPPVKRDPRGPPKKIRRIGGYKEDPYVFMSEDNPIWPHVRDFYGLDQGLDCTNFLRRSEDGKIKNIYITTKAVRDFVMNNENTVKIINVGVKALARADKKWTPCDFRLSQEGLPSLSPFIKSRRVQLPKQDLEAVLLNDDDKDKPPLLELLSEETRKLVEPIERGSLVLDIDLQVEDDGPLCKLQLVGWKGTNSLRAYIQKNDRVHYLRLCGADVSKYEKNKFKEREEAEAEEAKQKETGNNEPEMDMDAENGEGNGNGTVASPEEKDDATESSDGVAVAAPIEVKSS
ncbi:unnamed protein product [Orchesella dallaii]|uniref:tRNA (cytosine(34)-C(5))-methyltransferase n=1 Tax=Orchesella dallaii TaxID=48710 RepID=A0ABP1S1T5_9HEXA